MYWQQSYIRAHEEVRGLGDGARTNAAVVALMFLMFGSIAGNYLAGWLAQRWGYRRAIVGMLAAYGVAMLTAFSRPWSLDAVHIWFIVIGACQGVFGLFTMCLPPLFPTLLRTTGAGFCYNIGRVFAAAGTVFFGLFIKVNDYAQSLFSAAWLFIPAALLALFLPSPKDEPQA
jgi:MFS family permease